MMALNKLNNNDKPLYTDGDMNDPIEENDPLEAHKRTMNSWTMMQASYAVIREKVYKEGASINVYALIMWAYDQPACKAYYGEHPWLLRKQIGMVIEAYASDHEAEVISFNKGDSPI